MADQPLQVTAGDCIAPRERLWGDWLRLLRLPHWVKNAIVFPGVVLAGQARDAAVWTQALWVFAAFCLASSGVYALNDLLDRDVDRLHPLKSRRPVAAGVLTPGIVVTTAACMACAGLAAALAANAPARVCVASYLGLNLLYSFRLKHIPVVDASCVALGFVLRLVAVTGTPGESLRGWLLAVSVFFLCFFVAISKRAADVMLPQLKEPGNGALRLTDGYTCGRLRGLLAASALLTVLCYLGFSYSVGGAGAPAARLSVLPVAYALLRLDRLSRAGLRTEQIDLVRTDARLIAAVGVWAGLWAWAVLA